MSCLVLSTFSYVSSPITSYNVINFFRRVNDPSFYIMDIDDEEETAAPIINIAELKTLSENYIDVRLNIFNQNSTS